MFPPFPSDIHIQFAALKGRFRKINPQRLYRILVCLEGLTCRCISRYGGQV